MKLPDMVSQASKAFVKQSLHFPPAWVKPQQEDQQKNLPYINTTQHGTQSVKEFTFNPLMHAVAKSGMAYFLEIFQTKIWLVKYLKEKCSSDHYKLLPFNFFL